MGWTIGLPSLKLNLTGNKSKHCGGFYQVAAEALQERLGRDTDINKELTNKNIYLGYKTAEELIAYSTKHCSTLKDAIGRAVRSDAVRMCVTIIKPPAAFMYSLSEKEQKQFLDDSVEKFKDIVGKENIKSLAYHFDEQGAHVHIFWEPMTKDGRLCAKETHNLKYFSKLNKELPQHLRECGWDIDDCNAYDQAKEKLLTEKEKAERRQKNGRSSYVYKADAQQKLNEIHRKIDWEIDRLEERLEKEIYKTIEVVANNEDNIYSNVLFLMAECEDERFEELNKEGEKLKERCLYKYGVPYEDLDTLISNIKSETISEVSWEERQRLWGKYKNISRSFWDIRAELKEDYQTNISKAYEKRRNAMRSYYDALYFLRRSHGFIGIFVALIWISVACANQKHQEKQITILKEERSKLIANTASFKKYSNAYREELKSGKLPFEKHLDSMAEVVRMLDEEADNITNRRPIKKERLTSRVKNYIHL